MKKILLILPLCLIPACTCMKMYELTSPSVGSVNIRKVEEKAPTQKEVEFNRAVGETLNNLKPQEQPVPKLKSTPKSTEIPFRPEVIEPIDPALILRIDTLQAKYKKSMSCPVYHAPTYSYE